MGIVLLAAVGVAFSVVAAEGTRSRRLGIRAQRAAALAELEAMRAREEQQRAMDAAEPELRLGRQMVAALNATRVMNGHPPVRSLEDLRAVLLETDPDAVACLAGDRPEASSWWPVVRALEESPRKQGRHRKEDLCV